VLQGCGWWGELRTARYAIAFLAALLISSLIAVSASNSKLGIGTDGFPTGQSTPEGAATDLARAFMSGDADWVRRVCVRRYGTGQSLAEYTKYLEGVSAHLSRARLTQTTDDAQKILKVFAARRLSKNGPASYGYAMFEFQDLMFVDVKVLLRSGATHLKRTLVIKDRDGKWYAHPMPDVSPLLSDGLYDESASVKLATGGGK
jgi:hypothetical protein